MYLKPYKYGMYIQPRVGYKSAEHLKRIEKIIKDALPKAEVNPWYFRDTTLFCVVINIGLDENSDEIKAEYENKIALLLDTYKNQFYAWDQREP